MQNTSGTILLVRALFTVLDGLHLTSLTLSTETATGQTQWELPGSPEAIGQPTFGLEQQEAGMPAPHHTKRRQYAAGQTQAYQGTADTVPQYADPVATLQPGGGGGGQLFTPGFTGDGFQQQQQQAPYFAPEAQYGQAPHAAMPPYQQQGAPIGQLGDQFGQMNLGGAKPVRSLCRGVDYS